MLYIFAYTSGRKKKKIRLYEKNSTVVALNKDFKCLHFVRKRKYRSNVVFAIQRLSLTLGTCW